MEAKAAPETSSRGKIQIIKKGQAAPFDGVIYDNEAHALLVSKTKAFQEKLKLELGFLKQRLELQCQTEKKQLTIDLESAKKQIDLESQTRKKQQDYLLKEIEAARKNPWYREPLFSFSMGFLVCALITGLSIWGFHSLTK